MGCHCVLENISILITRGITYLVERGYLLALWLGKLEIQLLPPTQAVNSPSKVTSSKDKYFFVSSVCLWYEGFYGVFRANSQGIFYSHKGLREIYLGEKI